jgi:hypothetical protein
MTAASERVHVQIRECQEGELGGGDHETCYHALTTPSIVLRG